MRPDVERLLRAAQPRAVAPLDARERAVELTLGLAVAAGCLGIAVLDRGDRPAELVTAAVLLACYVLAGRVTLSVGLGSAMPTQVVLVPMLLLLPPALVPLLVAAGILLSRLPEYVRGRVHPDHALLSLGDAGHALGPALVLALAAPGAPALEHWPVYLAALAAQLVTDIGLGVGREWLCAGVAPRLQAELFGLVLLVDVALAPVGLLAAIPADDYAVATALPLPLLALLARLSREREHGIRRSLELSDAYRGTALLMGDVLEADDAYTGGEHTQGVVGLALAVATRLGCDDRGQRSVEFTALLHDIGKIRTPKAIINKPGALDEAEWEIVRRHPIDGQRMLERVGGVLAEIGAFVRSHHERWDGRGYPDGLVGREIPLPSRIIAVCDAFSAMTTNRSYRRARPAAAAIEELRRCAGSQFDAAVVEALAAVVEESRAANPVAPEISLPEAAAVERALAPTLADSRGP